MLDHIEQAESDLGHFDVKRKAAAMDCAYQMITQTRCPGTLTVYTVVKTAETGKRTPRRFSHLPRIRTRN